MNLVAAHEQCMEHVKRTLSPVLYEGIDTIWKEAVEIEDKAGGYEYLKTFQICLRTIPKWNQTILNDETKRIVSRIPNLMKFIAGIFVSAVKTLTSIKTNNSQTLINIKLPTVEIIIHDIYIRIAQNIYESRETLLAYYNLSITERKILVYKLIERCVEESIESMIPFDEIAETYLDTDSLNDMGSRSNYVSHPQPENLVPTQSIFDTSPPITDFSNVSASDTSVEPMNVFKQEDNEFDKKFLDPTPDAELPISAAPVDNIDDMSGPSVIPSFSPTSSSSNLAADFSAPTLDISVPSMDFSAPTSTTTTTTPSTTTSDTSFFSEPTKTEFSLPVVSSPTETTTTTTATSSDFPTAPVDQGFSVDVGSLAPSTSESFF